MEKKMNKQWRQYGAMSLLLCGVFAMVSARSLQYVKDERAFDALFSSRNALTLLLIHEMPTKKMSYYSRDLYNAHKNMIKGFEDSAASFKEIKRSFPFFIVERSGVPDAIEQLQDQDSAPDKTDKAISTNEKDMYHLSVMREGRVLAIESFELNADQEKTIRATIARQVRLIIQKYADRDVEDLWDDYAQLQKQKEVARQQAAANALYWGYGPGWYGSAYYGGYGPWGSYYRPWGWGFGYYGCW